MSHDRIKSAARRRMAETGEQYTVARLEVMRQHAEARADPEACTHPAGDAVTGTAAGPYCGFCGTPVTASAPAPSGWVFLPRSPPPLT